MCFHNGRLDESFCWKCCSKNDLSEIDYDRLLVNGQIPYMIKAEKTINSLSASELELFVAQKMEIRSLTVDQFIASRKV